MFHSNMQGATLWLPKKVYFTRVWFLRSQTRVRPSIYRSSVEKIAMTFLKFCDVRTKIVSEKYLSILFRRLSLLERRCLCFA